MIYFPEPYPDELLYSVFCRYADHVWPISYAPSAIDLFGNRYVKPNVDFRNKLTKEAELCLVRNNSISDIVLYHTMFPYYCRFFPKDLKTSAFNSIIEGSMSFIPLIPKALTIPEKERYLCYCPQCAKEDRERYGETYWHRVHQIPEMTVCPKHRVRLLPIQAAIKKRTVCRFFSAQSVIPEIIRNNDGVTDMELALASRLSDIFFAPYSFCCCFDINEILHSELIRTGYFSVEDCERDLASLLNDLFLYYNSIELSFLNYNTLSSILERASVHPFDIALVSEFLGTSVKELVFPDHKQLVTFDETIISMYDRGLNFVEISQKLDTTYDYVYFTCMCGGGFDDRIRFDKAAYSKR